jgi:hypothetical protein
LNRVAEEVELLDKGLRANGKEVTEAKGNGKTFVQNLFEGVLTNETRCLSCETVSLSPTEFGLEIADSRHRLEMSSFWICRSISNNTHQSHLVSDNSLRAKCCAKKTNSSAIHAAVYKKLKRGKSTEPVDDQADE